MVQNTKEQQADRRIKKDEADLPDPKNEDAVESLRDADETLLEGCTASNVTRRVKRQIRVRKKIKISKGHSFKQLVAKDHSRVQYGDTYKLGSCTHSSTGLDVQVGGALQSMRQTEAQTQAMIVTLLVLIFQDFLKYILNAIPKPIGGRVSVFEDAFRRIWRIDIDTISDWQVSD